MRHAAAFAIAACALFAAPVARAEYKFRVVSFSVAAQAAPLDRLRFYQDGIEVGSLPATWYGCEMGCMAASVRLYLDGGHSLTMRTERAGELGPVSPVPMPTEIFETLGERARRGAMDVNGDCRIDSMDELIRELVRNGELE